MWQVLQLTELEGAEEAFSDCVNMYYLTWRVEDPNTSDALGWPEPSVGPVQMLGACASTIVCATKNN